MVLNSVLHSGVVSGLKFSSWDGKTYCWAPKYLLPAAWPFISSFRRLTSPGLIALFKWQNTISVILLLTANTTETTAFSGLSCMHWLIFFHKREKKRWLLIYYFLHFYPQDEQSQMDIIPTILMLQEPYFRMIFNINLIFIKLILSKLQNIYSEKKFSAQLSLLLSFSKTALRNLLEMSLFHNAIKKWKCIRNPWVWQNPHFWQCCGESSIQSNIILYHQQQKQFS